MEFRLDFTPKPFTEKIQHHQTIMLVGSCFTEQMGTKLNHHLFSTLQNPNGILFNPISIINALEGYIQAKKYSKEDLFFYNELWGSWDHHTRFSSILPEQCLQDINQSQEEAHHFLKKAQWLIITLGSSFVYRKERRFVANCHKVPTDQFEKVLLNAQQIETAFAELIPQLQSFNPELKLIFTISPVRHLRDGFVENNRSKANLIAAVHALVEKFDHVHYFPSYELIMDDLRDYRFFAEDMVHPNYAATQYVWEKFIPTCMDPDAIPLLKEIAQIAQARLHKPFNPESAQHQKFLENHLQKTIILEERCSYLDLSDWKNYFSKH